VLIDDRLVDEDGNDITAFDTRGEACVRGPTVVRQYHGNPKANAETWDEEGYLHSGDILYCDSKTKLWYIVDRKKVCLTQYLRFAIMAANVK
jgi:4-coumarate--CoA ligase